VVGSSARGGVWHNGRSGPRLALYRAAAEHLE
jgi:hypothetical protein